jgi:uncharacterized protein involved in type VI secretion and phage assembly
VTKIVHTWKPNGYTNEFWATPWKKYVNPQAPQRSPVHGFVPARVVDHNDPRKMGRIKIKYPWQEEGETGWVSGRKR